MALHFKDRIQLTDVVLSGGLRPIETEIVVIDLIN